MLEPRVFSSDSSACSSWPASAAAGLLPLLLVASGEVTLLPLACLTDLLLLLAEAGSTPPSPATELFLAGKLATLLLRSAGDMEFLQLIDQSSDGLLPRLGQVVRRLEWEGGVSAPSKPGALPAEPSATTAAGAAAIDGADGAPATLELFMLLPSRFAFGGEHER